MAKSKYFCFQCGEFFLRYSTQVRDPSRAFCSRKCSATWNGIHNNPNAGNKWSEEKKAAFSASQKIVMSDSDIRWKSGSANRGKTFSPERVAKMHGARVHKGWTGKIHSEESKKLIGQRSKEKFTPEYKEKFKVRMIELGKWLSDEVRGPFKCYYEKCNWIERMFDRFDSSLLESGIFNSRRNPKGVVRDHKFSRPSGWALGVFPEIMRHPVNCAIIPHAENVRKKFTGDTLTLEELLSGIEAYDGQWKEQEQALKRVKEYRKGKRYDLV